MRKRYSTAGNQQSSTLFLLLSSLIGQQYFKFLFMFSKKLGGNFKKLANYSEKSASHSKKAVVVPENTGGASCIPCND